MSAPTPVDPKSGFCSETKTFRSLRPRVPLPDEATPLSFPSFAFSLLPSPLPSSPAFVDSASGLSLSFPDLLSRVRSLRSHLRLPKGCVAFVLSPPRLDLPVLYLSLLSLGAVVSPANPLSTPSELSRLIHLVRPSVVFATSSSAPKLPPNAPAVVLLDSPEFRSLMMNPERSGGPDDRVSVSLSDPAALLFSSGTTGLVKAAAIPHRSLVAMAAEFRAQRAGERGDVTLLVPPMFHSFGFVFAMTGVAMGDTTVVMSKVGFGHILMAAARYRATVLMASPPVVVAMARSEEVKDYDLGALEVVICGGAALPAEAAERFMELFPRVELRQGYGSTEGGGVALPINREECKHIRSAGRLRTIVEARIVDVVTRQALSVGQQGELLLRGPATMIGYVGDDEANASTFDSEGWLRTGDLCYFDDHGFLYVVDRLKELIKYKAYQVPPAELELLLNSMPEIADAAVAPYPQEEVGEIPMAFVVRQHGSNLSEQQVMDYVAKRVAPYKKIRKVVFVESIPKSAAGKILRRELASLALRSAVPTSRL